MQDMADLKFVPFEPFDVEATQAQVLSADGIQQKNG